jgi:hypothetical protein
MASVFALLACLAAGTVLGAALDWADGWSDGRSAGWPAAGRPGNRAASGPGWPAGYGTGQHPGTAAGQTGTGILAGVALGLGIAGLYAVTAGLYFGLPVTGYLRWTLPPVAAIAALAAVIGVLATRYRQVPHDGWHTLLAFPATSIVAAAAGMAILQYAETAPRAPGMLLALDAASRLGGLLIGVGAALALVPRLGHRIIVAVPLSVFTAAIANWRSTGVLAVVYTVAVTLWWAQRLWHLARSSPREPIPRPSPGPPMPGMRTPGMPAHGSPTHSTPAHPAPTYGQPARG